MVGTGPAAMTRGRYPWIVMRDSPGELLCKRCGESYKPTLPCLFDAYIAICKAFTRSHRRCNDAQQTSKRAKR